ncbi:hypothetical protein FRC02_004465 [Tulasnella sp. 418]|nr:hypothetical protein FRC02_004465 [Tulasnella sp. 418]
MHPSAEDIQLHLYHSFLQRQTTDICLQVRAKAGWNVEYHLHRVVLIQAGFFRSLFTTGFLESSSKKFSNDCIPVQFDDPNITRAAFEFCLARLYGGGPNLHVSQSLKPSVLEPLTPYFLTPPPSSPPPPAEHHPATSRFLLSLIATSIYLSIPSITSSALSLVLATVGPHTVIQYLNFAIGRGIGDSDSAEDLPCLVGLEHVGREVDISTETVEDQTDSKTIRTVSDDSDESGAEALKKFSGQAIGEHSDSEEGGGSGSLKMSSADDHNLSIDEHDVPNLDEGPKFSYGAASNKIGESCACWLTRWGKDILPYEEEYADRMSAQDGRASPAPAGPLALFQSQAHTRSSSHPPHNLASFSPKAGSAATSGRRATFSNPVSTTPSITFSSTASSSSSNKYDNSVFKPLNSNEKPPTVWARGGLTAEWARGILSSDDFFLPGGEMDRYLFATRVVELRRKEGRRNIEIQRRKGVENDPELRSMLLEDEQEERQWSELFRTGFYYSHMSLEEMLYIQNNVSPTTCSPYVHPSILQLAHWNQSIFRMNVLSRPSVSNPGGTSSPVSSSPPAGATAQANTLSKDTLGQSLSTSEISAHSSSSAGKPDTTYFPILTDGSQKLGTDSLSTQTASPTSDTLNLPSRHSSDETNFFGIQNGRRTAEEVVRDDPSGAAQWTINEPCSCKSRICYLKTHINANRFSVEFWNVESLKPSHRLYSQTFWCMGSLWNVYVQVARKKGLQMGVYLQRQSFVDSIPPHSIPPALPTSGPTELTLHHSSSVPSFQLSGSRSSTPRPATPGNNGPTTRGRPWSTSYPIQIPQLSSPSRSNLSITRSPSFGPSSTTERSSPPGANAITTAPQPSIPNTSPGIAPTSPYRDPRQVIQAHGSKCHQVPKCARSVQRNTKLGLEEQ